MGTSQETQSAVSPQGRHIVMPWVAAASMRVSDKSAHTQNARTAASHQATTAARGVRPKVESPSSFPRFSQNAKAPKSMLLFRISGSPASSLALLHDVKGSLVLEKMAGGRRKIIMSHKGHSIHMARSEKHMALEHAEEVLSLFLPESVKFCPILPQLFISPAGFLVHKSDDGRRQSEEIYLISMPFVPDSRAEHGLTHQAQWGSLSPASRLEAIKKLVRKLSALHSQYGLIAGDLSIENLTFFNGEPMLPSAAHLHTAGAHSHGISELLHLLCQFKALGLVSEEDVASLISAYLSAHENARAHAIDALKHRAPRKHKYYGNKPVEEQLYSWFEQRFAIFHKPVRQEPHLSISGSEGLMQLGGGAPLQSKYKKVA